MKIVSYLHVSEVSEHISKPLKKLCMCVDTNFCLLLLCTQTFAFLFFYNSLNLSLNVPVYIFINTVLNKLRASFKLITLTTNK